MILTLIYRGIVLLMLCMTIWNLFREKDVKEQLGMLLVIAPLVLRFLMIK